MTAASANLPTSLRQGRIRSYPVAASVECFEGALIVIGSDGYARPGRASTTDRVAGRCVKYVKNGTTAGDVNVQVDSGNVAQYANSTSGDAIAAAHIGQPCYVVDDATVALTDNSGARVRGGQVFDVDSSGVWVDFAAAPRLISVTCQLADVSTAGSAYVACPATGKVVRIYGTLSAGITGADSAVTTAINGVAITGGGFTAANAGSAAGTTFTATPTAANACAEGQYLSVTSDGASSTTSIMNVTFVVSQG